jgi:hypothetical protein
MGIALPPELILRIIDFVPPSNQAQFLNPVHTTTRTLLALCLTSRLTYTVAIKYLGQHCVYIDDKSRLIRLVNSLRWSKPRIASFITSLHLAVSLQHNEFDELAVLIESVFARISPVLKRLVVELRRQRGVLPPAAGRWAVLRRAFASLIHLEEFVSVADATEFIVDFPAMREHAFDDEGIFPPVWTLWPSLKRLALFGVYASPVFWQRIAAMTSLDHLVLTRSEGTDAEGVNIKQIYFTRTNRPIKIILADVELHQPYAVDLSDWSKLDPDGNMYIALYNVPTSYYGDDDNDAVCAGWVRLAALNGSLWGWTGERLGMSRRLSNDNFMAWS